jgi:hypothetical protein
MYPYRPSIFLTSNPSLLECDLHAGSAMHESE